MLHFLVCWLVLNLIKLVFRNGIHIYIQIYLKIYGSIWTHMGPYGLIWTHMGPYGPVWACVGPARAHAAHETISDIATFFQNY